MLEAALIMLRRQHAQPREPHARNSRKIMMFEMQAVIDRNPIHRTVIGGSLIARVGDDMLLQDMRTRRMRTNREIGGEREIEKRAPTQKINDQRIGNSDR